MYSLEERLLAVKTYYEMGRNAKATVRRLGYPDETNITRWVKEYERDHGLHEHRVHYSKYTDSEKQAAIEYYYTHGQNGLQTVKDLGYPSRTLLTQWVEENPRDTRKDCKKRKTPVRCSEEQREQAVLESCKGTTLKAIAETYGVTEAAIIQWREKYLGKVRKKRMPDPSPQETLDIVQLQKEKQALEAEVKALRREHYRLQLENDALKEAARLLKKARGINLKKISNREKAMVIDALRDRYPLKDLLALFCMAKSSYCYQEAALNAPDKYRELREELRGLFAEAKERYGYRRLHAVLRTNGRIVSEKVVRRIMREEDMKVYHKRRRGYSSYKGEISPEVENVINRDFHAGKPNEKWLTDITEFSIPAGKVYLSPLIDCFDGMPVSWTIGTSPNSVLVNTMLDNAISTLSEDEKPLVHSDRGCHYRWPGWIERMEKAGLTRSMSKKGCSPDNSACEGFFGRLKNEMFYGHSWKGTSIPDFIETVDQYIHWYAEKRIKMSLGGLSPLDYRRKLGLVP